MCSWLKKFAIDLEGKPIVIKTDMHKWYNESLCDLNVEDLLKYISSNLNLDPFPYENCIYAPNNYHFYRVGDTLDSDPGFYLNVINGNYNFQLRFTDYDTTRVNNPPKICCIL